MSVTLSNGATADVIRTSRHYDTKPGQYGVAFENEIEAAVVRIARAPRMYSPVEDGIPGREIREYFIERFEQRGIYLVTGDDVLVSAVVHASAREGSWHDRIGNVN